MHENVTRYLDKVTEQIRWKRARKVLMPELESHINDQRDEYIADGMSEEEATNKAVIEMGDPIEVGVGLDRIHRPKLEKSMLILMILMLICGFVYNIMGTIYDSNRIVSIVIGIALAVALYYIDYTVFAKCPLLTFGIVTIAAFVSLIVYYNGFTLRYFSTYLILLMPVALILVVYAMRNRGIMGLIFCGFAYLIEMSLSIMNIYSRMLTIVVVSGAVILIYSAFIGIFSERYKPQYTIASFAVIAFALFICSIIIKIFHPAYENAFSAIINSSTENPYGYMSGLIREIIPQMKLNSRAFVEINSSWENILNILDRNSYQLTWWLISKGWIYGSVPLVLSMLFLGRGFMLCTRQKSILGRLTSFSILTVITVQTILYMLANLGIITASYPMPIIARGNISFIVNMAMIGLLMSVYRTGNIVTDKAQNKYNRFISYEKKSKEIKISLR